MINGALISDRNPGSSKGGNGMTTKTEKLAAEIQDLTDVEKLLLVDEILSDLDKPDPEIDHIWAEEARKRWTAYKAGHIKSVSYQEVMDKYRRS
jgi:putative addiction module component (TIGR02574 family)